MELESLSSGEKRRLSRIVQAVGVRSPEQPDAREVLAVIAAVDGGRGGELSLLQRSILSRILQDSEPYDLRFFLGSDERTGLFLAAAVRLERHLKVAAFQAAALLEFHPADVLAIRDGRDPWIEHEDSVVDSSASSRKDVL